MLSRGIGKASVDNVIKVCKGLGITTDDLERLATQEDNTVKEEVSIYETIQNDQSNIIHIPIIGSVALVHLYSPKKILKVIYPC